jgi:hypothetical protein
MINLNGTTAPKSDQLNADDMISGSMTLEITNVRVTSGDQPISIDYKGGQGRPYKPCKSMRRVLIGLWGDNGEVFIGRTIIVYNDKNVKWAGKAVGGIRISHMSHIEKDERVLLTETRGKRVPCLIKKLEIEPLNTITAEEYNIFDKRIKEAKTMADLQDIRIDMKNGRYDKESNGGLGQIYGIAKDRIMNNENKES